MKSRTSLFFWVLCFVALFVVSNAPAEVRRIEITSRTTFSDGRLFGKVGPYETIRGKLFYAVDPANPRNAAVVDLNRAPKGEDGAVHFSGDFLLVKPVSSEKGNGRLLYDVNNRGNLVMLRSFNDAAGSNDPLDPEQAGNGFLMDQGYSLLWTAWNWDVRPSNHRLQIELPIATNNGNPIRQRIAAEIVNSFGTRAAPWMPLAWGNSRCYPAMDPMDNSDSILTVRVAPNAERKKVPNNKWRFARLQEGQIIPDPTALWVEEGLLPGRIYELVYETQNPRIVGLGLTAVRDAISFFRFNLTDSLGNPNPLSSSGPSPDLPINYAYIFGVSQSGRFITHMIWQGFHVDARGRMVFDGARIHVPGGGKGGFNHRFAQTTHHPSDLEGNYMPADHPPFNYLPDEFGSVNDVLAEAKRLGKVPRIIIANNTLEYWARSASLIHTDISGSRDAPVHPSVRIYMTNGAPHVGAGSRRRTVTEHERNPLSVNPLQRALLVALDEWVTEGTEPPANRYPRIDQDELITASEHKKRFPAIPGLRHPGRNLQPPRVDYGKRFWTEGIFDKAPPDVREPYITLVPAFDSDGNGVGGIRLPELTVPLGTYQGWNPRKAEFNAPDYLTRFDGLFWVFPVNERES